MFAIIIVIILHVSDFLRRWIFLSSTKYIIVNQSYADRIWDWRIKPRVKELAADPIIIWEWKSYLQKKEVSMDRELLHWGQTLLQNLCKILEKNFSKHFYKWLLAGAALMFSRNYTRYFKNRYTCSTRGNAIYFMVKSCGRYQLCKMGGVLGEWWVMILFLMIL